MNTRQISVVMARIALFVIYFWFGLLKVLGQSPATPMVEHLLTHTMPFMSIGLFLVLFGLFEMFIGLLFLIPSREKLATALFFIHMLVCALPLFMLGEVWTHIFVPTLEGQYIIKNLALIACALSVLSVIPKKPVIDATI